MSGTGKIKEILLNEILNICIILLRAGCNYSMKPFFKLEEDIFDFLYSHNLVLAPNVVLQ